MKNLYSKGYILIITFLLFLSSFDQLFAQVTTVGKEFWVGFMENYYIPRRPNPNIPGTFLPELRDLGVILITSQEQTQGVIEYNGRTITFNIPAGGEFIYKIEDVDILHRTNDVTENKGVRISSSNNVSVYAFNERQSSADGTVVLPITTLGKDYFITSHFEIVTRGNSANGFSINNESLLLVVGTENNTQIEITPSVNALGRPANVPYLITLNSGQSYQLKARNDLTGTRVRVIGDNANDCKNIAVFGGNKWTQVGDCGQANDHLFQQAYPVNTWGNEFLHIPFNGRTSGELVKVLVSENNTEINVNGVPRGNYNRGEFLTLDFSFTETAFITGNKPISVTTFSKSMDCNLPGPGSNIGDPFMISYSPNQQQLKEITFNAIQLPSITSHYVNVITATASIQNTLLDGQNVGNEFVSFLNKPDFSYARIQISSGVHRLENPDGFIGYVYGFGNVESYGYAVGASLENLNFEVISEYDFEVEGESVACLNQTAEWEINPENEIFQFFTWNFGDGSPIKEGKLVQHKFESPGTYEVVVTASISDDSCDQQEEVRFEVLVEEYVREIIGPNSVCPDIDEIIYTIDSDQPISKIEWRVEGGEIIDETVETVTIRWGSANPSARLYAIPYNLQGCPGEEIQLSVVINNQIQPKIALGDEDICFDGTTIYEYTVAEFVNGRGYEWFIIGGDIIGSNENNTVEVNWSIPGTTGQLWYREYSLINDDCEGESPILNVIINNVFNAVIDGTTDILCFGEETGNISVTVTGGTAPYTFEWSHDANLNAPLAPDVTAGVYSVLITDSFGCEILLDNIEVNEPPLLALNGEIQTIPTTCFGRADGEARIRVQGGVAPYQINLPTSSISGDLISLFELEGRDYELEITDSNGCLIPVSFTVESPLPLEVDVRIEKLACPGESNGELFAEPSGGNGPFSYSWTLDGSDQPLLIGVPRGVHDVTVVDSRGCISFGSGEMFEDDPIVRMPTGFDPKEGLYQAVSNCTLTFEINIYNRWGELIYFGSLGWDGTTEGSDAPIGTYSYSMVYNYILNGEPKSGQLSGNFTLVR
ncbi:SprB repeat-containing protein [Belliella buryatensis]|uniref:SprB repeat-containing protein n=1 Tax=Belliella buryatensis TaxID=1500549 RepID=A0A239D3X2_9BACT|nr:PKD domain-containing protein [Belliella buryatensis]SNS26738.1 SprB repeat-containing protein [Belliella buryatensis]